MSRDTQSVRPYIVEDAQRKAKEKQDGWQKSGVTVKEVGGGFSL